MILPIYEPILQAILDHTNIAPKDYTKNALKTPNLAI